MAQLKLTVTDEREDARMLLTRVSTRGGALPASSTSTRMQTTSTLRVLDGIATPTSYSLGYVLLHTDEKLCRLRATAVTPQQVLTWSCTFATEH